MSKVIVLFNQSGGVGKSTLTMNLGYHLTLHSQKVLLVDMDPQGSLTTFMGLDVVELKQTVYESVVHGEPLPIHKNIHKMDLVPANINLSAAEMELVVAEMREVRLKDALEPVLSQYDFILIDCPPSLGVLSYISLIAATHVLVPIETQYKALLYRMQNEAKGKVTRNVTGSSEQEQVQWVFEGLGLMSWESFIRNRLPLRNLPEDILEVLRQGKLAYTKAQVIARVKDDQARKALLEAATSEDLSLTQIKERIAAIKMKSADNSENPPSSLKSRVDTTYAKLKKLKLWDNPNKQERLEKLLVELEALVSEG